MHFYFLFCYIYLIFVCVCVCVCVCVLVCTRNCVFGYVWRLKDAIESPVFTTQGTMGMSTRVASNFLFFFFFFVILLSQSPWVLGLTVCTPIINDILDFLLMV